jgi:hypothetical protein
MRISRLAFGLIVLLAAAAGAQEVPMVNPGFETFGSDPDPVIGWIEFDGNSNGCTGSNWRQGGSTCGPLADNPEGVQVISSRYTATHTDADDVALAQVVSVTPATVYEVSGWLHFSIENDRDENDIVYLRAADGDVSPSLDCLSVQTAGVSLASATAASFPECDDWRQISGQISVYSNQMTVITGVDYFEGGGGAGANVLFLDDFHITVVGPAFPEPSESANWEVYR